MSIIVAMKDSSADDLDEYLSNGDNEVGSKESDADSKDIPFHQSVAIPLTRERLEFLLHLLDDVHKFV